MALNVPGLDFEKGLKVFEDEIDDYIAALHSFVKNTPEIIDKLRRLVKGDLSAENLPEYAITIHGLKSVSAWICAETIHQGAVELDAFAKSGDISAIIAHNDTFLNGADAFIQNLKAALESRS